MKLTVERLKTGKLAPKNLKPLLVETTGKIKDLPGRITERADQVLLGLSHTKQSIPTLLKQTLQRIESNPSDIVGRVSRQVLERAETVRKQLIEKAEESGTSSRWVPDWLKDVAFVRTAAESVLPADALAEKVETASEAKVAKPRKAKASKGTKTTVNSVAKSSGRTVKKSRAKKV